MSTRTFHLERLVLCTLASACVLMPPPALAGPKIALTFDDGPHATLTPRLLTILKSNGARATFFPIGESVGVHPEIVAQEARENHEIGNHGWGHLKMKDLPFSEIKREITRTSSAIWRAASVQPVFFRPPHGSVNARLRGVVFGELGLDTVTWSVVCGDWGKVSVEHIERAVTENAADGSVVLMHDTNPETVRAAEKFIPALRKRGFEFVTLSDLKKSTPKGLPDR